MDGPVPWGHAGILQTDAPGLCGDSCPGLQAGGFQPYDTWHALGLDIGSGSYTFCMIFVFVQIKRGGFALSWKHFYLLALLASPFLLHIVTGQPLNAPRAELSLPLLCAFLFWKYYGAGRWPSRALCLIIASQLVHSQLLMYSDYLRNENDKAIAEKIYKDCGADEDTVIVFKGVRRAEDSVPVLLGHVIGRSFFEWTPMTDVNNASVHRIRCFMEFYGMDFVCPDDATAARGERSEERV